MEITRNKQSPTLTQRRQEFVGNLLAITGDTRLLWVADGADTTTSTTRDLNQRTVTWDATVAARLSQQGFGWGQSFNGTTQYGTVPDAANLSFSSAAFSLLVLANVTDTANFRAVLAKYADTGTLREYTFDVTSADKLRLQLIDESADKFPDRTSDAAFTQGAVKLLGATYDGGEGATAANGIALYVDGAVVASTATNDAAYVAMEDTSTVVSIGARGDGAVPTPGTFYLAAIVARQMTASEMWAVKELVNAHYGLSL